MPTNADLGRALARLRRERGLSVAELAEIADCTPAWLEEAERGAFSPGWNEIGLLAQALDVRFSTLTEEVELEMRDREV